MDNKIKLLAPIIVPRGNWSLNVLYCMNIYLGIMEGTLKPEWAQERQLNFIERFGLTPENCIVDWIKTEVPVFPDPFLVLARLSLSPDDLKVPYRQYWICILHKENLDNIKEILINAISNIDPNKYQVIESGDY